MTRTTEIAVEVSKNEAMRKYRHMRLNRPDGPDAPGASYSPLRDEMQLLTLFDAHGWRFVLVKGIGSTPVTEHEAVALIAAALMPDAEATLDPSLAVPSL